MADIKFSILCASYNHSKYIVRLINSILQQAHQNFEIIIVDDCSTDNTEEVVTHFSDSRIKFFRNERNFGINYTLQRAFEKSSGEYAIFIGSDDEFASDYLSVLNQEIEKSHKDLYYTDYIIIDENSKPWKKQPSISNKRFNNRFEALKFIFYYGNPFSSPGMVIKHEAFASILPLPMLVIQHQDLYMHTKLLMKGDYGVINYKGIHYRQFKSGNISRYSFPVEIRMKLEYFEIWDLYLMEQNLPLLEKVFEIKNLTAYDICLIAMQSNRPDLQEWGYQSLVRIYSNRNTYKDICERKNLTFKDFLLISKKVKKYTNYYHIRNLIRNLKYFGLFN